MLEVMGVVCIVIGFGLEVGVVIVVESVLLLIVLLRLHLATNYLLMGDIV